jgi:hypothetical protein
MKDEVSEYIHRLDEEDKKDLLMSLFSYNKSVSYGLDNEINLLVYTSYMDCIKAKLMYNNHVKSLNRNILIYGIIVLCNIFVFVILFKLIFLEK